MKLSTADAALVQKAASSGVLLAAERDRLRYLLPPAHDAALLTALQAREKDILAALEFPAAEQIPADGPVPATGAQIVHIDSLKTGLRAEPFAACAYTLFRLPYSEKSAISAARALERRHDAFRMDIAPVSNVYANVVRRDIGVALACEDLSKLPDEEASRIMQARARSLHTQTNNLGTEPHCRVAVFGLRDGLLAVMVLIDHVFGDGASAHLAMRDFARLYAQASGIEVEITAPKMQFPQHARETARQMSAHAGFWQLYLAGAARPDDGVRRLGGSVTGIAQFDIGPESYARAKNLAAQAKTPVFAVILARIFGIAARINGRDDVTVGVVTSNRESRNHDTVGLLADSVFVRGVARLAGDPQYISYIGSSLQAALSHRAPRHDISHVTGMPRPDILVNFVTGAPRGGNQSQDGDVFVESIRQALHIEDERVPALLFLDLADDGSNVRCKLRYNSDHVDAAMVADIRSMMAVALN